MKKTIILTLLALLALDIKAQVEYTVITTVESIVPAGIGRSRMIANTEAINTDVLTTERTDGTKSDMDKVKRKEMKIDNFEETKLLNFYSIGGINFRNVATNDAVISSKINEMSANGWELAFVSSAVESDGGETDGQGIFITRYVFKR